MKLSSSLCYGLLLGAGCVARLAAAPALPVYQPEPKFGAVYFVNPAIPPVLRYNHDVDIIKFKGRFFAAWNANETQKEDVPGQFNFLSSSADFTHWSPPVRMFTAEGKAENPVESDNQWQPNFINWHDQTLFCAWSDFVARRVFVAQSDDGEHWKNVEVPNAPPELAGQASGFPTNHGLLTSAGVMLFPCSVPFTDTPRAVVGHTRYAGVLRSEDHGKTWTWSKPIEALSWSEIGENPAEFGGETVTLWEPMLFEEPDGAIGLLIRNSTAQDNPERAEKPHRMLLYARSTDAGKTWTKARTVELDTICVRDFAVTGIGQPGSLAMVVNDNNVRVPERISHDRYYLSLYFAPICNPDLLLPGPQVQPTGGTCYYPNGFVSEGKLYLGYSSGNILTTVVDQLPDFRRPFLLPRGGRPGLKLDGDTAYFAQRQSTLGLVLTEQLTLQPQLTLAFDYAVNRYDGTERTILTLGGKTRDGTAIRAIYDEASKANVFQLQTGHDQWTTLAKFELKAWTHFELQLGAKTIALKVNGSPVQEFPLAVLRKIAFGGLYVPPEWPVGMARPAELALKLDTLVVR